MRGEGWQCFKKDCGDGKVGRCKAIPPVVARIFSGDSTSPLTREASAVGLFEGLLFFAMVVGIADFCVW